MSSQTIDTIDVADLHAWASGSLRLMAAIKLLDDTDMILEPQVVKYVKTDDWVYFDFEAMRRGLSRMRFSSGEKAVVEAALSLAGKLDVDLGGLALSLGPAYKAALIDAFTFDHGRM